MDKMGVRRIDVKLILIPNSSLLISNLSKNATFPLDSRGKLCYTDHSEICISY